MTGSLGAAEIADDLKRRINLGEWARGEKMPTTAVFAAEYKVHRNTINNAMLRLIVERVVRGDRGGGRYVA
jgi:DNA-binding GntR family transcriptional regulator